MVRIYRYIGSIHKSASHALDGTWILNCDDGTTLEIAQHSIREDYEDGERVQVTEFRASGAGGRQICRLQPDPPHLKPGPQSERVDPDEEDDERAEESWDSDYGGIREEETGLPPVCPFCGGDWDCAHLVAAFDMSFLSIEGGALTQQMNGLCMKIGQLALRLLQSDPKALSRTKHPNLQELFADVKSDLEHAPGDGAFDDGSVRAREGHLIYLCNEILPSLDVEQPSGSFYEGDRPGYSSVMKIYWAKDPQGVLEQLEARLLHKVHAGA